MALALASIYKQKKIGRGFLKKVINAPTTNHLLNVLLKALEKDEGIGVHDLASKLLYLGVVGVMVFQGTKTQATIQL